MAAKGGRIDFMFLGPPYPATGSATVFCLVLSTEIAGVNRPSMSVASEVLTFFHLDAPAFVVLKLGSFYFHVLAKRGTKLFQLPQVTFCIVVFFIL